MVQKLISRQKTQLFQEENGVILLLTTNVHNLKIAAGIPDVIILVLAIGIVDCLTSTTYVRFIH